MIDQLALPNPSSVTTEDGSVVRVSSAAGGNVIVQDRPDAGLSPVLLSLAYASGTLRATLLALRDHYTQWHCGDFDWVMPGETIARRWIYREPTQIKFETAGAGSARVTLEEVLAHD